MESIKINLDRYGNSLWTQPSLEEIALWRKLDVEIKGWKKNYSLLHFLSFSSRKEALFLLLQQLIIRLSLPTGKNHFLISSTEELSLRSQLTLWGSFGVVTESVTPSKQGSIDPIALQEKILPTTAAVIFSYASRLSGLIQPLEELYRVTQAAKVPLILLMEKEWPFLLPLPDCFDVCLVDSLLLSKQLLFHEEPLQSLKGLSSFFSSYEKAAENRIDRTMSFTALREEFESSLVERCNAIVLFPKERRLPTTTLLSFPSIHSELLFFQLQAEGVRASLGGGEEPSLKEMLQTFGVDPVQAANTVSFSFGEDLSREELHLAIDRIEDSIAIYKRGFVG